MVAPIASLGEGFSRALNEFAGVIRQWPTNVERNLLSAHKRIGKRWHAGAVKRVPVDESTLKQRIVTNTSRQGQQFVTEVGTNVPHGVYVEFGTRHIAGGRVLALGSGADISDADAITSWPAKDGGIGGNQRVQAAIQRRHARGDRDEQMPWLRPAFNDIRDWAIKQLNKATEPPR